MKLLIAVVFSARCRAQDKSPAMLRFLAAPIVTRRRSGSSCASCSRLPKSPRRAVFLL